MAFLPYILVCAGEDSGDVIGEPLVKAFCSQHIDVKGAGGRRMQSAGMVPLVDFEVLPVSGFGDVLPKYFKLRQCYNELKSSLESPECLGLVAIDYPGFNMKLVERAGELRKPALYVAPPQVWAWKKKRAKVLARNPYVKLAVFFDFEEQVYREAGCNVVRVKHPFVNSEFGIRSSELYFERHETLHGIAETEAVPSPRCLLLPGSRKAQALRNLSLMLKAVQMTRKSLEISRMEITLLAARWELVEVFENALHQFGDDDLIRKVHVVESPQEADARHAIYQDASLALTAPGTATLELALSGCPMIVCVKPDALTYGFARVFVKTKYFALPNIILNKLVYPEKICAPGKEQCTVASIAQEIASECISKQNPDTDVLYSKLSAGMSLGQLAAEFFRQFIKRESE